MLLRRTAYSRVQLRILYTATNYPEEAPVVELTSPTLPAPLLRNKEKECQDKAKECLGRGQAHAIYQHMHHFIHENMFIPCWKEVKQISTLCEGKGQIGANEKEGIIQLRLRERNYRQAINLRVPANYPEEGVAVEITQSSFPLEILIMYKAQSDEISRRCVSGFSPEQALQGSNAQRMQGLNEKSSSGESKERITAGNLKNIKHDVNVLKQMSDLRSVNSAKDKRNQGTVHSTAERRDARKDLRKLAKAESEADAEREKELKEQEQREMQELMGTKPSDTAQPSLLATARFLIEEFSLRLPHERCQNCARFIFPDDPSSAALTEAGNKDKPVRTYCGHWLHYDCLNTWLTTPPFIRQCPVCDRRIWHPDWPSDVKQLERAWQNQEARKREISDVSDFMGMDDTFSVK